MMETPTIDVRNEPKRIERDPKDPFYMMLKKITSHDDDLEDMDVDKVVGEIMLDSKDKVDGYFYLIKRLESLALEQAAVAKVHAKRQKNYESKRNEIERKLIRALDANGFEKFAGNQVRVKLSRSKETCFHLSKPDDTHAIHFSDWVRTKYEWEADALKKVIQRVLPEDATPEQVEEMENAKRIAYIKVNTKVEFDANKEVD